MFWIQLVVVIIVVRIFGLVGLVVAAGLWALAHFVKGKLLMPEEKPHPRLERTADTPIEPNRARFFRDQKNVFGLSDAPGADSLTDQRINEIYLEVRHAIRSISATKNDVVSNNAISGLVRDMLLAEVNGDYPAQLKQMTAMYSEHPLETLFWKGRAY